MKWSQNSPRKWSRTRRRPQGRQFEDLRTRKLAFEELEDRRLLAVNFVNVANSLNSQLLGVQSQLTSALNNYHTGTQSSIPMVGDSLGSAAQIVSRFNSPLQSALSGLGTISNPSDSVIKGALASTPFLVDRNSNGVGPDDVLITRPGSLGSEGFAIQMRLQGAETASVPIDFDTGLPGLPLSITANGSIDVSVGFAYELAFTYNSNTLQVALDSTKTLAELGLAPPDPNHEIVDPFNPVAIFVSAVVPSNFNASATVGFVQGTMTPLAGQDNALYLTVMANNLTGTPTLKLDGTADTNLRLTGSFAGTGNDFPGIDTDFHLHWSMSSAFPNANSPEATFDNVTLDLGRFLSNVVGPVLLAIQDVTEPLEPVLKILNTPVPGMSDLSNLAGQGDITLLELAGGAAQFTGYGPLYDLANKVIGLIDQVNSITVGSTVRIPLGGFNLDNYDLRTATPSGEISNLELEDITDFVLDPANIISIGQTFQQIVANLPISNEAKDVLGQFTAGLNNGFNIEFPILDDPAQAVFDLLLGKDSDLFYLTADADLEAHGQVATGLKVFNLDVVYGGDVDVDFHFKFAYDTFGLRELINHLAQGNTSSIATDIADGFYVAADSYFNIAGEIYAAAGPSLGFFQVLVGGRVGTGDGGNEPVSVTVVDPNMDGKLRIAEFATNPLSTSGELTASLGVEVRIGREILGRFFGVRKYYDIAHEVLVTFVPPPPPTIASQPDANGEVTLYLGQNANLRQGPGLDQVDGDESFTIRHVGVTAAGDEIIKINAFGVSQIIEGVRSISAYDEVGALVINVLPGVTSDVHFEGGQGPANLSYRGTGSAVLVAGDDDSVLTGGSGPNQLYGGAGDDTLVLGGSSNLVSGGGGHNTIVAEAPITQAGVISGGDTPNNSLVILAATSTFAISATPSGGAIDVGLQNLPNEMAAHLLVSNIEDVFIGAQDSSPSITLGDLTTANVAQVTLNLVSSLSTSRIIDLETRAANAPANLAVQNLPNEYVDPNNPNVMITEYGLNFANNTTGMVTQVFGFADNDSMTVRHHGGSIQVDVLPLSGGHFTFDTTNRTSGQSDTISITTPPRVAGIDLDVTDAAGDVLITTTGYSSFLIKGLTALDQLNLDVSAHTLMSGANTLDLDASSVKGELNVSALGNSTAVNHITLSNAGPLADVSIFGQNTTTDLLLATGQLAAIEHDVTASNVQLTVDNRSAPAGSLLTLAAATFGNWVVPGLGVTPKLNHNGLRGPLEIFAGAGDRYQLDITPGSVTSLTMHNDSTTLDPVYTANWVVPLMLLGNFAFYAGQRLLTNGTVERVKRLNQVGVPVMLAFNGVAPTKVVLDGDLDPPGAQYALDGVGLLHVLNSTAGLNVMITGFRDQDELYVYMPGATVAANLQRTSPGTIYLDGSARLSGTNPTSSNNITLEARYGQTELVPLGQYNSRLDMFNDVYLLGSMPQDNFTVNVPTNVVVSMAIPTTFNIQPIVQGGTTYSVPARTDAVIAWIEGARPGLYSNFIIPNPSAAQWDSVWHGSYPPQRFPNPLGEIPYGVDVLHEDAAVDVTYSTYFQEQVSPGVYQYVLRDYQYPGTVRYFLVDPNPVATNNDVRLDASQLRGNFNFNITGPDYDYVFYMMDDSLFSLYSNISYPPINYFRVFGNTLVAFGQNNVVLAGAHPQSSVNVTSQNRPFTYSSVYFPIYNGLQRLKSEWSGTTVYVGEGTLANVQGQVSVDKVWLKEVDGRQGTQPNILTLTTTALAWTGASGALASLTMGQLYGELTITGSPFDRFAVEGTPNTAWKTTIRNFGTSQTSVGVYVMAKTVMPLEVTGNFELYVGQRLNADGTVTAVGQVRNVFNKLDTYHASGYPGYPNVVSGPYFDPLYHNLKLVSRTYEFLPPTHIQYVDGNYNDLYYVNNHAALPVFYTYTGAGQGKLVFDAHDELITGLASDYFKKADLYSQGYIHGISTNYLYPGMADLRFYRYDVLYGPNAEVFMYGPRITQGASSIDPAPATLLDNPFSSAVHYIANPNNTSANILENVLIGNVNGPVYVEGNGRATRVEINPLYSLPTGKNNNGRFESDGLVIVFPGWGRGRTGGFSLIDTVHADVTVNNAALRVIADIPLPTGSPPVASRPDVTLTGSELVGIAGGTIHFSNLVNSITTGLGTMPGILDIGWSARYLPGLTIQLPAHAAVSTIVQDTPAAASTVISTLLSASDTAMTDGPITVRGTTGPLVLGQLLGPTIGGPPAVDFHLYSGILAVGQPIGSLLWGDGLSVPQVAIGDNGSLQNIQGPVFLSADSHVNSPLATIIDGRNDPNRPNVSFTQPTYTVPPSSIVSLAYDPGLSRFYQQVDGLASAPIYFGDFFKRPRTLEIYGSAGSTYNVPGPASPSAVPPTMKLYTGANGSMVYNSNTVGPMSIIGATTVQFILGNSTTITGYTGPPQILVEQDPAHPQQIDLRVDRHPSTGASPSLNLTNAGNGLMSLASDSGLVWWRVFYAGADTHLTINYGSSPVIVSDTGAAGTEISPGTGTIDVFGTTYPLTIHPSGSASTRTVRLGQTNNMQAILGEVEIRSNAAAPLGFTTLTMNNSADTAHRDIHLATDVGGNTLISGMAPGLVKLVGERFTPTLTGGTGGSTWYVESAIFPLTSNLFTIVGGATSDLMVGPNLPNTWNMDAANSVRLGANFRANNMRNLRGGANTDLFRSMSSAGTIAGNLDGGGGFNTLEYVSVPNPFVTDLVGGIAPRIGGTVSNIHAVIPEQLSFTAPSSLSNLIGDSVNVQLTASSTVGGTLTYGASGLPNGLSINPMTGLISGTIAAGADLFGPYQVTVTVTNGSNSRLRTIDWAVAAQLPGDFNEDGFVDAADYAVWRKLGGSQTAYNTWRAHFGQTFPGSGNGASAVAEPSAPEVQPIVSSSIGTAKSVNANEFSPSRRQNVQKRTVERPMPHVEFHARYTFLGSSLLTASHRPARRPSFGAEPSVVARPRDEALMAWLASQPDYPQQSGLLDDAVMWNSEDGECATDGQFDCIDRAFDLSMSG